MALTLLCIDDERNVLAIRRMLRESVGYHVVLAESGLQGLEVLKREHVDTVILDYRMPEMTGAEVRERIRQMLPSMPIIMLSAYVDLSEKQLKDVDAYLTKGESPDVLLRTIEGVQPRKAASVG